MATIRLINVIPMTPVMLAEYVPPDFDVQQRGSAEEALATVARESGLPADKVSTVVRQGGIYHEVLEEAKAFGCDIIVMSSHRPAMKTYFLGSNAGHMVRYAKCSVLVVRKPALTRCRRAPPSRHRIGRKNARPVAVEECAGLPEEKRQKRRDERGAAPGCFLQGAHDQPDEREDCAGEDDDAGPIEEGGRSGLKQRLPAGRAGAPAQLRHERPIARVEPLVLDEALPRCRCDLQLRPVRDPDFGEKPIVLHRHRPESEANAPDAVIRRAPARCALAPFERVGQQAEIRTARPSVTTCRRRQIGASSEIAAVAVLPSRSLNPSGRQLQPVLIQPGRYACSNDANATEVFHGLPPLRSFAFLPDSPSPPQFLRPPPPPRAQTIDGNWSVLIVTERGPCDAAYRYGLSIRNGRSSTKAAPPSMWTGRVSGNGAVSRAGLGRLAERERLGPALAPLRRREVARHRLVRRRAPASGPPSGAESFFESKKKPASGTSRAFVSCHRGAARPPCG